MELNEKWKLTTQNNAYLWEGNQISKQNRYPWYLLANSTHHDSTLQVNQMSNLSPWCDSEQCPQTQTV